MVPVPVAGVRATHSVPARTSHRYDRTRVQPSFACSLAAGGIAGTTADVVLFPLDTLKTRLQAPRGFRSAGGLAGVYRGLGSAALGSFPASALFFTTYEATSAAAGDGPAAHMLAGVCGECVACLVRVPTENVKQKVQVGMYSQGMRCARGILATAGWAGFYTGYGTTVLRDVPFAAIQFPIYEGLKRAWSERNGVPVTTSQAALCGSAAGGIAGALITPLDVTKTRLMLGADANGTPYRGMVSTMRRIYHDEGARAFTSGLAPRVFSISLGGAVFLGSYEHAKTGLVGVL